MRNTGTMLVIVLLVGCSDGTSQQATVPGQDDNRDIAGEYYHGDGLGSNNSLTLRENSTFSFNLRGCVGTYDDNDGTFRRVNDYLVMSPTKPIADDSSSGMATKFLLVGWGKRQYLIPDDDLLKFCNYINQGMEPRDGAYGSFFMRRGDWERPVTDIPILPKQYEKYLLAAPLHGTIVKLIDELQATVDLGATDGIRVGIVLTAQGTAGQMFCQLRVKSVDEKKCTVVREYEDVPVTVGQIVSSIFYDPPKSE
jgi:hypothetical protein